ncbi:cocaine esterase [Clostridium ragsdalei P11]|uniref:Cocaine esterase n=1 Tax=Clostridium ragsdalei P11 TaxID=1353534 RepID=A0A1A6B386_9CLOT|nr:CocE/NonD family hydrolase [Clostridium ragsdalei]OBR96799.1 cocaine esterase [Clostridium ragsdalei P11]
MSENNVDIMNESTNHHYDMKWKEIHIPMRDGSYLAANLYQPDAKGKFPVLMTMGPYGKDEHFASHPIAAELYKRQVQDKSPHMSGGTPDPDFWVPQGYVVIRIDERGTGNTPGILDVWSDTLKYDYYDAIEWAGTQSFGSGKVGLLGCSYFAITQWMVAEKQPPHLSCLVMWEGMPDLYADALRMGGIVQSGFLSLWYNKRVLVKQFGKGKLSEDELKNNRTDFEKLVRENVVRNEYWKKKSSDLSRVTVPFLSAGNWFCSGAISRGNINGFKYAASKNKWLEMHIGSHFAEFYTEESRTMQKQFLDYWLKGIDTGVMRQPKIKLAMPKGGKEYNWIYANEYPLKNTKWTKCYLEANSLELLEDQPLKESKRIYEGDKDKESAAWQGPKNFIMNEDNPKRMIFKTKPLNHKIMLAGPMKLRLYASSTIDDMDIYVSLRNIAPDGKEVVNVGAYTTNYPISQGWLRASLRGIDEIRSTEYKPYYTYDKIEKLVPNKIYPIDIEIADSAIMLEKGHTLLLEIGSQEQSGCGMFLHPDDKIWDADVTVYTGGQYKSYLLLPLIL